jgi:hypothetical protein
MRSTVLNLPLQQDFPDLTLPILLIGRSTREEDPKFGHIPPEELERMAGQVSISKAFFTDP